MKATVQISIEHLRNIIEIAEKNINRDNSLSQIVTITVDEHTDSHNGQDSVSVYQLSSYSECDGVYILANNSRNHE